MKTISRHKLEKLYNGLTNKELCKMLGISNSTLVNVLRENDIPLKGPSRRISSKRIIVTD